VFAEYGPRETEMRVIYASDGHVNRAEGARGGYAGSLSRQYRRDLDGTLHDLPGLAEVVLRDGETVLSYTTAGGGYGPPTDRDPELVRRDVREGLVSRERARDIYGVVLDETAELDHDATRTLRAKTGSDRPDQPRSA
jgi:N-methylhydantoinase B